MASLLNTCSWTTRGLLVLVLVALLTRPSTGASIVGQERTITESSPTNENICKDTTPCGWAVYTPFIRRVDFFIRNKCECPTNLKCMRASDDLSVSAYVYQCIPEPPNPNNATS